MDYYDDIVRIQEYIEREFSYSGMDLDRRTVRSNSVYRKKQWWAREVADRYIATCLDFRDEHPAEVLRFKFLEYYEMKRHERGHSAYIRRYIGIVLDALYHIEAFLLEVYYV